MKKAGYILSTLLFIFLIACSNTKTKSERDATYVKDGDTINPMEGEGEGTAGNKYMESAENADSTKEVQQDLGK